MSGDPIRKLRDQIPRIYSGTVVSTFDPLATEVLVALDLSPEQHAPMLSLCGPISKGTRVTCMAYPPRGFLVLGALPSSEPAGVQTLYATPGTTAYSRPSGGLLRGAWVECQGGGGAGGGSAATGAGETAGSGGGQGGHYAKIWLPADLLPTNGLVTVGAGGVAVSAGTGGNGGTSQFENITTGTILCQAGGGAGGAAGGNAADTSFSTQAGGTSVFSGIGTIQIRGGQGGLGMRMNTQFVRGGYGGMSHLGNWRSPSNSSTANGVDGTQYGGAGSGSHNTASLAAKIGGNGGDGCVIITHIYD